ncbi:hypothetical protein ScPMuIL_001104 [Solemya velum]
MTSFYELDPDAYSIYKVPDGEDTTTKTALMAGYGAFTGTVFALYDVIGYTKPSTPLGALRRLNHWVVPLASVGAAYAATTSIVARVRNKDDQFNHFWGGFISGSIFGLKYKSLPVGFNMGLAIGLTTMLLKRAYMENWRLRASSEGRKSFGHFHHYDRGYGITRPNPEGDPNI